MKPPSLEGLRRLVRSRDKQPDQTQKSQPEQWQDLHPFWRTTNSFKRASIRRSARRYEKIQLPNGVAVRPSAIQRKCSVSSDERPDDGYSTDGDRGGGGGIRVGKGGEGGEEAFEGVGVGEGWGFIGFGGERGELVGGGYEGDRQGFIREEKGGGSGLMDGCWFPSTPTTAPKHQMITYDEWRTSLSDEHSYKYANESQPSTLSANKLSSRDSGVRHSLDSKTKFSTHSDVKHLLDSKKLFNVESNTNRLSLDRHKTHGVDNDTRPIFQGGSPSVTPRMTDSSKTFRRSSSADSSQPSLRIKNLLGSPRVAPKTSDPPNTPARSLHSTPRIAPKIHERPALPTRSLQSLLGSPRMAPKIPVSPTLPVRSLHTTPIRTQNYQPLSAPPTPGKNHVHRISDTSTPIHQLRASWHEREMRRCNTNFTSGSPIPPKRTESKILSSENTKCQLNAKPQQQSRWAAIFSRSLFSSLSPSRKKQQKQQNQQLENAADFSPAKFSNSTKKHIPQQQESEKQRKFSIAKLFTNSPLKKNIHLHKLQQEEAVGGCGNCGRDSNDSPTLIRQQLLYSCDSPTATRHTDLPSFTEHTGISSVRLEVTPGTEVANCGVPSSAMAQTNTTGLAYGMARAQGGPRIKRDFSANVGSCNRGDLCHVGGSSGTRGMCLLPGYGSPSALPRHMRQEANSPLPIPRHHPVGIESGAFTRNRSSSTSSYDATLTSSPRVVPRHHHQGFESGSHAQHQTATSQDATQTSLSPRTVPHRHHQGIEGNILSENASFQNVTQISSPKPAMRHRGFESISPTRHQFNSSISKEVSKTSSPIPFVRHSSLQSGTAIRQHTNPSSLGFTSLPVSNELGFSNHQNEYGEVNLVRLLASELVNQNQPLPVEPINFSRPLPAEPVNHHSVIQHMLPQSPIKVYNSNHHFSKSQELTPHQQQENHEYEVPDLTHQMADHENRPTPNLSQHQTASSFSEIQSSTPVTKPQSFQSGTRGHHTPPPSCTHQITYQQKDSVLTLGSPTIKQRNHYAQSPLHGPRLISSPSKNSPKFKAIQVLGETVSLINASQFYPGKLTGAGIGGIGGNSGAGGIGGIEGGGYGGVMPGPSLSFERALPYSRTGPNPDLQDHQYWNPSIWNYRSHSSTWFVEDSHEEQPAPPPLPSLPPPPLPCLQSPAPILPGVRALAPHTNAISGGRVTPDWVSGEFKRTGRGTTGIAEGVGVALPRPSSCEWSPSFSGTNHTHDLQQDLSQQERLQHFRKTTTTTLSPNISGPPIPPHRSLSPHSFMYQSSKSNNSNIDYYRINDMKAHTNNSGTKYNSHDNNINSHVSNNSRPKNFNTNRPFFLAMRSARPHTVRDLASPASTTSEGSNRGRRKRGPGLLVSRASWLFRVSSTRRSAKTARRAKKQMAQSIVQQDHMPHESQISKKQMTHYRVQKMDHKKQKQQQEQILNSVLHHNINSWQNNKENIDEFLYEASASRGHPHISVYQNLDPITKESTQKQNLPVMLKKVVKSTQEQTFQDITHNSQEVSLDSQERVQKSPDNSQYTPPYHNSNEFVSPQHLRNMDSSNGKHFCQKKPVDMPESRTAHANLLMPLNHPVGSSMVDGRSQRAALLVRSLVVEDEVEIPESGGWPSGARDTCSEPGGVKFNVLKHSKCETAPWSSESNKSEPGTVKFNLRMGNNTILNKIEPGNSNTKVDIGMGSCLNSRIVKQPIESEPNLEYSCSKLNILFSEANTSEPDTTKINPPKKSDNGIKTWNTQVSESLFRSNPGNTKLNLRIARNPELLIRALAALTKLGKGKNEAFELYKAKCGTSDLKKAKNEPTELGKAINHTEVLSDGKTHVEKQLDDELAKERIITQDIINDLMSRYNEHSRESQGSKEGSIESLISIRINQDSQWEGGIRREPIGRIRRKRSQKTKRIPRLKSPRVNLHDDVTRSQYDENLSRLLQPYDTSESKQGPWTEATSSLTSYRRRPQRRVPCNEFCYHSKVRQEAVKEALSQCQSPRNDFPLPYKRSSIRSPERHKRDSDSVCSEDDSVASETSSEEHSVSQASSPVSMVPLLLSTPPPAPPEKMEEEIHSVRSDPVGPPQPPDPPPPPIPPHGKSQLRRYEET